MNPALAVKNGVPRLANALILAPLRLIARPDIFTRLVATRDLLLFRLLYRLRQIVSHSQAPLKFRQFGAAMKFNVT